MPAKVSYRMNPSFEEQIMGSRWLRELVEDATRDVVVAARRLAPRLHGFVIESIQGVVGPDELHRYAIGRVFAGDFKAAWHEFGTRNMHPHPFLLPALEETLPGATILRGRGARR